MGKIGIYAVVCLAMWCGFFLTAGAQQTWRIDGRVATLASDGKTVEGLPYAGVVVLNAKDSSFVKGTAGDQDGAFKLNFVAKKGVDYLLKASYTGMEPCFRLLASKPGTLHAGTLLLQEADTHLGEVTVTAEAKAVRQVKDTTVINATVYKTPEGSYLEELLKRIPGLTYDKATQTITYNGKAIGEINVNGESFFGGDRKMALENLPAEVIEKVKVYDKKSKLEKVTGVRNGKENYVLDLQTKQEYNSTLLASGKAGYGNHRKKELGLVANYFNTNGEGYSLMARSSNRAMESVYKGNIANSVGVNVNKKFREGLMMNGSLSYGRFKSGNESTAYNEQYLATGNKYLSSSNGNVSANRSFNGMAGVSWEADERTFVNASVSFNVNGGTTSSENRQASFTANPHIDVSHPFDVPSQQPDSIRLNESTQQSTSSNNQNNYSLYIDATRKLNKTGTNVSLIFQAGGGGRQDRSFDRSSITYYQLPNQAGTDSVYYQNQFRQSPTHNDRQSFGMRLTHPFTKELNVQLSYTFSRNVDRSDRNTYDLSSLTGSGTPFGYLPDTYEAGYTDSLSNRSSSRTYGHSVALYVNYTADVWNVDFGFTMQPQRRSLFQKTGLQQADSTLQNIDLSPTFSISWTKEENYLRLGYQGNTSQPQLESLLSLADNSNPLSITHGNPDLKPSYSQSVMVDAQLTRIGLSASWSWRNELNSQTTAVIYNRQTGGTEAYPVNIDGNWGTYGTLRYQKRIRDFNIAATGGGSYNQSISLLNEEEGTALSRSRTRSNAINSELRLSYYPAWGSFDLGGAYDFQHSNNSLRQTQTTTRNYTFTLNAGADVLKNFRLSSDALYSFRNGTNIRPGEDDQLVWNAGITYRFLKQKQAELSAYWADILSQKKNYQRSATASGFYEYHSRQIGSYFILSFKYKLTKALHNNTK